VSSAKRLFFDKNFPASKEIRYMSLRVAWKAVRPAAPVRVLVAQEALSPAFTRALECGQNMEEKNGCAKQPISRIDKRSPFFRIRRMASIITAAFLTGKNGLRR